MIAHESKPITTEEMCRRLQDMAANPERERADLIAYLRDELHMSEKQIAAEMDMVEGTLGI